VTVTGQPGLTVQPVSPPTPLVGSETVIEVVEKPATEYAHYPPSTATACHGNIFACNIWLASWYCIGEVWATERGKTYSLRG